MCIILDLRYFKLKLIHSNLTKQNFIQEIQETEEAIELSFCLTELDILSVTSGMSCIMWEILDQINYFLHEINYLVKHTILILNQMCLRILQPTAS